MNNPHRTMKRRSLIASGLILLQVLVLAGIAISYYAVGWYGQDIRVKTIPVDPRDVLYGDYVTLNYEISRLDPSLWKEETEKPVTGHTVYVVVRPGSDGTVKPIGAYASKPSVQADEVILKGRIDYSWNETIVVKYGVEQYFVPEGTGNSLEKKASRLIVTLKVAPWGQAKIESIEDRM